MQRIIIAVVCGVATMMHGMNQDEQADALTNVANALVDDRLEWRADVKEYVKALLLAEQKTIDRRCLNGKYDMNPAHYTQTYMDQLSSTQFFKKQS